MKTRHLLPRDAHAPAAARLLVSELDIALGWRGGDARLVATELVSQCVRRHDPAGGAPIGLSIEVDDRILRIEVCDPEGAGGRSTDLPDELGIAGIRLVIIDVIADEWGVSGNGQTCTWATIALPADGREG